MIHKYKAWDKQRKTMYEVKSITFEPMTISVWITDNKGFDKCLVIGESGELLQFTGLTDKNGVEIYEGDIVKHSKWVAPFYDEHDNMQLSEDILEVYFDDELLEFGVKNSFTLFHCQFSNEFEKIGTIFENPELLEGV